MKKNTISLTCIMKNEIHNLPRLLDSIKGCFDEIHFTDTGSSDGSAEFVTSGAAQEIVGCPVRLHRFEWVNDFSLARNYALKFIETDYWMWLDLDDVLSDAATFIKWRDVVMPLSDMWYAPYWYALDASGNSICSFLRERVIKNGRKLTFTDFIHEGIKADPRDGRTLSPQVISTWYVKHMRTAEEMQSDKGRNLSILESNKESLSPRMLFYLGKEYFDNGNMLDAANTLAESAKLTELEPHDRITALQYLGNALFNLKHYSDAISYLFQGVQLSPNRAEYYCLIGDCYLTQGQVHNAIPMFNAAINCVNAGSGGVSPVYTMADCYGVYPRRQLAICFFNLGEFQKALDYLEGNTDANFIQLALDCKKALTVIDYKSVEKSRTEDIVITCPPQGAYLWDSKIYREFGVGGSETAACEVAKWIRKLTGRNVIIFNPREDEYIDEDGVIFRPSSQVQPYFREFSPRIHIAWRHAVRLTDEPTYVWCHDLLTPGAELTENYDKIICLSEFHKSYVQAMQNVPDEKIIVSRNGIDPLRFEGKAIVKQRGKVIFSSSPNRGLEQAILTMDLVRSVLPECELHVFYGMENMRKYGEGELADKLEAMMQKRPWVIYHGNVNQGILAEHMRASDVWLYPTWFMETYCITALEALCCKAYPITRAIGALENTLNGYNCDVMDLNPEEYHGWAAKVIDAIVCEKWKNIDCNPRTLSWESVAREWVLMLNLEVKDV